MTKEFLRGLEVNSCRSQVGCQRVTEKAKTQHPRQHPRDRGRFYYRTAKRALKSFSTLQHPRGLQILLSLCHKPFVFFGLVAGTTGLEPATSAVTGQRSNQLSYVPTQYNINHLRNLSE